LHLLFEPAKINRLRLLFAINEKSRTFAADLKTRIFIL